MSLLALCAVAVVFLLMVGQSSYGDLAEYVAKPDPAYAYSLHSKQAVDGATGYVVRLTSQNWHGTTWTHWLSIIRPDDVQPTDTCLLVIYGNDNTDPPPSTASSKAQMFLDLAKNTKSMVAVLQQVPNQPLFEDLREDALIAYTFEKYLDGEGDDWPVLLPMVKSAVRAMDTVQSFAKNELNQNIRRFVVTGASKRGWTTWLTGAVDKRVVAIAPAVFDVLGIGSQMEHQVKTYGGYSRNIGDYTKTDLPSRMTSERGRELLRMVDPIEYLDKLTMPKLILLGTNDGYWTADSASLYFPRLKGPKFLHYDANAGHNLDRGARAALLAFHRHVLTGEPMPEFTYEQLNGTCTVSWDSPRTHALLWKAHSSDRDFREAKWRREEVHSNGRCEVQVKTPAKGWTAYYVELLFETSSGLRFGLSTPIQILPPTFPPKAIN